MVSVDAEIVNLPLECHTKVSAVDFLSVFKNIIYRVAQNIGHCPL